MSTEMADHLPDSGLPAQPPIRILLVDDHTLFRGGIRALLSRHEEFAVVGEAGDALEGVKRARSLKPDVVLLDLHMEGLSGVQALRLLVEEVPDAKVLMLTVSEDEEDLFEALRMGAAGYLLKNIDASYLLDAIRRALQGEAVIAPRMTGKLLSGLRTGSRDSVSAGEDKNRLSPREAEIVRFLAKGASNKEIANALSVAESTIKIHVQNIFKKLNVTSRVQVAVYAVAHGLAEQDA